jgi:2-methylcitrate dehydratase PrpD
MADSAASIADVGRLLGGAPAGAAIWPLPGDGLGPLGAAYTAAALSCAHDYDDYLFLAHTGHSACGVPWTAAQLTEGATVRDVLVGVVACNEVMGRLGAACLVGPQNGQLWTFVHLAGASIGAARIAGLSADTLEAALSLAFFQPPMALWQGFGRADSKHLSAATPTLLGLLATEHARRGLSGSRRVLEGRGGFFDRFSFLPLDDVFEDLGRFWVTDTVSIKPVPGCAYVTAVAEAALACTAQHVEEVDRPFAPAEIERVEVLAGPMTLGMERLLGARSAMPPLRPVAVNFSVPLTAALALIQGRLDVDDLTQASLEAHADLIGRVASRVRLRLDGELTGELVREVGLKGGVWRALRSKPTSRLLPALLRALRASGVEGGRGSGGGSRRVTRHRLGDLGEVSGLSTATLRALAALRGPGGAGGRAAPSFPFGAEVRVRLDSGRTYRHRVGVPRGAAGSGWPVIRETSVEKLARESGRFLDASWTRAWGRRLVDGEADEDPVADVVAEAESRLERRPGGGRD